MPGGLFLSVAALSLFAAPLAHAQEINAADTAWLITATALVMMMTPAGLALFYGGLTRRGSVMNTNCIASLRPRLFSSSPR